MTGRSGVPGAIFAVLGATALVVFSTASVNVALPSLTRSFGAEPADVLRVTTVYHAALAAALLPCAALGESLGLRRVFTAGLALFTGASLVAALAPSLEWLLVVRGVQGIGVAAILALGVANSGLQHNLRLRVGTLPGGEQPEHVPCRSNRA